MFRRENRKSFGETEKIFWSKPSSEKGFGTCLELFAGCWKCSGTFRNFSGENGHEKHNVPDGGQDPMFREECFVGRPLYGAAPHLVKWMLGGAWWEASSHKPWSMVWGGGAPNEGAPRGWSGQACPPWSFLPPLVGCFVGGGPLWSFILMRPSTPFPHYK